MTHPTDTPPLQDSLTALAGFIDYFGGPDAERLAREQAEREVAQVGQDAGSQVPAAYVAALLVAKHTHRQRWGSGGVFAGEQPGPAIGAAFEAGMPTTWPATMAERGPAWVEGCVHRWLAGLTDVELARLDGCQVPIASHPSTALAYVGVDLDVIAKWMAGAAADRGFSVWLAKNLGHAAMGDYMRAGVPLDDVRACFEAGVSPQIARDGLTGPDGRGPARRGANRIGRVAQFAAQARCDSLVAADALRAELTAGQVKSFGPLLTVPEMVDLLAQGVPGQVARSLRSRDRMLSVSHVGELWRAGVTTGSACCPPGCRWRAGA